jgi:hypothetical protein
MINFDFIEVLQADVRPPLATSQRPLAFRAGRLISDRPKAESFRHHAGSFPFERADEAAYAAFSA